MKAVGTGESAKAQCFKGISMDSLPFMYSANKNVWKVSDIFRKWLMTWDLKWHLKSRKILMTLDNCTAQPHLDSLKYIRLECLSPNTTSLVRQMDMEFIKYLQTLCRAKVVELYILQAI
jgi:hypothetical protein